MRLQYGLYHRTTATICHHNGLPAKFSVSCLCCHLGIPLHWLHPYSTHKLPAALLHALPCWKQLILKQEWAKNEASSFLILNTYHKPCKFTVQVPFGDALHGLCKPLYKCTPALAHLHTEFKCCMHVAKHCNKSINFSYGILDSSVCIWIVLQTHQILYRLILQVLLHLHTEQPSSSSNPSLIYLICSKLATPQWNFNHPKEDLCF